MTCITVSLVLIAIGLAATFVRGKGMFDIDFLGGTSVQPKMQAAVTANELRELLDKKLTPEKIQFSLTRVQVANDPELDGRVFKIDTSVPTKSELEERLDKILVDDSGRPLIAKYQMSFSPPHEVEINLGAGRPAAITSRGDRKSTRLNSSH